MERGDAIFELWIDPFGAAVAQFCGFVEAPSIVRPFVFFRLLFGLLEKREGREREKICFFPGPGRI